MPEVMMVQSTTYTADGGTGPVVIGFEAGEFPVVAERVLISPIQGRFEPATVEGDDVTEGQLVGEVVRSDERIPVTATIAGRFMGHLAERGERVRDGQPIAWIRLAS